MPPVGGVDETLPGHRIAIIAGVDHLQVPLNRTVRQRICTQIFQYTQGVDPAGRLDDPGDHQIPEHLIADGIEAQGVIDPADRLVEQTGTGRRSPTRARRDPFGLGRRREQCRSLPVGPIIDRLGARGHLEPELALIPQRHRTGRLHENSQLSIGVSRSDMGHDLAAATQFLHHLHRHRPRGGTHLPHEHEPNLPA